MKPGAGVCDSFIDSTFEENSAAGLADLHHFTDGADRIVAVVQRIAAVNQIEKAQSELR